MSSRNRAMRTDWIEASLAALTPPAAKLTTGRALAIGLGLALLAFVLRVLLQDVLGSTLAFVTFYPAIALAAWIGGLRAGLLATVASTVLGGIFFLEPAGRLQRGDVDALVLFAAAGAAVGVIGWQLRRTHETVGRASRRAAVLTAVSHDLSVRRDRIEALESVVDLVVPGFADWCAVELVHGVTHPVLRVGHRDPSRIHQIYQLRRGEADLAASTMSSATAQQPSAIVALDVTSLKGVPDPMLGVLRQVGAVSYVGVPLQTTEDRSLGHLAIGMSEGDRRMEPADVGICIELGRIVSSALERMARSQSPG